MTGMPVWCWLSYYVKAIREGTNKSDCYYFLLFIITRLCYCMNIDLNKTEEAHPLKWMLDGFIGLCEQYWIKKTITNNINIPRLWYTV